MENTKQNRKDSTNWNKFFQTTDGLGLDRDNDEMNEIYYEIAAMIRLATR